MSQGLPEAGREQERAQFIMGQLGPLWYREYFLEQITLPTATAEDIDLIRAHFGVRKILVGHTTVPTVTPLCDGKVIAVQVYPKRDERTGAAVMEGVLVENGRVDRARIDGAIEAL